MRLVAFHTSSWSYGAETHDGSEAPSHEASKVEPPTTRADGRGQVFGLTSTSVDYRRLLAVASQS